MFTKKILAAAITSQPSANGVADAIDFDGVTDYLSRSSDLVGNADGKTFTFSVWLDNRDFNTETFRTIYTGTTGGRQSVQFYWSPAGNNIAIRAWNNSGTQILAAQVNYTPTPFSYFTHLLISIDLSNTSNRFVYLNDSLQTVVWSNYTNSNIGFSGCSLQYVGYHFGQHWKGRLAHVFLAYEYVDLSVEANRRVFITADRKPA